ncbi:hypothetical protein M1L60_19710 [Actinoplanes sp. TRM 88003]|uniref:Uncharacterized protein n=1 Tax=Paractinoplanes aksuensis TaxID=2939490 RepID=A0ABT1DRW7_9ACTN|nr:hypothetical protein [Actinoplanes aksuensis]MCO8272826.1 hypothetical protein [Actinoplanes aksuensis]
MSGHSDTNEAMAARIDRAADQLDNDAAHAAEVLSTRAGGDTADPQAWAARKTQAATAAREYAAGLREQATSPDTRLTPDQLAQADQVATAAECGGILIDGRPPAQRAAESGSVFTESTRDAWEAGTHPTQEKARNVEATGQFSHVAETIDGIEQVPFWQLGGQTATSGHDRTAGDEQGGHRYEAFEGHRGDENGDEF